MSLRPILFDLTSVVLFMLREDIIFRRFFYLVCVKEKEVLLLFQLFLTPLAITSIIMAVSAKKRPKSAQTMSHRVSAKLQSGTLSS